MVKIINKSVCRGVAGRRSGRVKGVVIHNTADNGTAVNHMNRLDGYSNLQLQNGFAHYFIDEDTIVRTEDTYNMAWHTANSDGNANYIGYEVCRSTGNEKQFLQAEQNTFKQVAEDLKYYGLPANRSTVRLHKEFVATACPHRSWDLHGKSINSVKDYFIKEIKKYYDNPKLKPNEELKPVTPNEQENKVNNNYYQKSDSGSLFELLKTMNTYNNKDFKAKNSKRRVVLPKSTRIYGDVVDYDKKTGVTRIKTQIGYITSNKKYVKKVWQNDKWYK